MVLVLQFSKRNIEGILLGNMTDILNAFPLPVLHYHLITNINFYHLAHAITINIKTSFHTYAFKSLAENSPKQYQITELNSPKLLGKVEKMYTYICQFYSIIESEKLSYIFLRIQMKASPVPQSS